MPCCNLADSLHRQTGTPVAGRRPGQKAAAYLPASQWVTLLGPLRQGSFFMAGWRAGCNGPQVLAGGVGMAARIRDQESGVRTQAGRSRAAWVLPPDS